MKVEIGNAILYQGDCLEVLRGMPDGSVDAVVTDPPYGLSFMGKKWDYDVPATEVWAECLRVLKPGGHLLAFAGTRTQHRMAVRIEDAGFEIRDMIAWVYGSGFPKSLDVSKAIDAAAGAKREVVGLAVRVDGRIPQNEPGNKAHDGYEGGFIGQRLTTSPTTEAAKRWQGWGTALKPALEPITVARKPLAGTVAANVLAHGTGAINVDGCRVAGEPWKAVAPNAGGRSGGILGKQSEHPGGDPHEYGRWPANLIHDGSDEVVAGFPVTKSGTLTPDMIVKASTGWSGGSQADRVKSSFNANEGSAARFFYCAKASGDDRGDGNTHPTVKPTNLMRYLCRLVTPPGGVVLDPFMGSGSTGKAALLEGFRFIGIERDAQYLEIARARIAHAQLLKTAGSAKLKPASKSDAYTIDLFSETAHP
jgi:DNA modification methylase